MLSGSTSMSRSASRDTITVLVVEHRADAIRFAWSLLGADGHMAEELAQRAFVKAWYRRSTFRGEARVKTWLYRIIVNEVRSYQRWTNVRQKASAFLRLRAQSKSTEASPSDVGLRRRLEFALSQLSPQQREAFVLVFLSGHTAKEAASLLGRSEGTIKTHVHRAKAKLRVELADLWKEI